MNRRANTNYSLQTPDFWKETIEGKVNNLFKEWEQVKNNLKGKRNSENKAEMLVEILKKASGICEQTPCTGGTSRVVYQKSLSPLERTENKNFESLISKCKLFQEGLSRAKIARRREDKPRSKFD